MEYVKFNTINVVSVRRGAFTIRISRKSASGLSKALVEACGLKAGDGVGFLKDKDGEWYLVKDNKEGFALRQTPSSGSLTFNSAGFANLMFSDCGIADEVKVFKVAREPVVTEHGEAWCIIVASGK